MAYPLLDLRRQKLGVRELVQRIEQAISAVRQEGGYAILLDAATDAIVSADTTLDVTQQVLARLQQQANPSGQ